MSLLVVGSMALDSVETPRDRRDDVPGGSAMYFSYAASYFGPVRLVGVVGDDWPGEHTSLLAKRGVDTAGLVVAQGEKTFRWSGKYHANMNDRDTVDVQLNVLGKFDPILPSAFRDARYVFLANGATTTQLKVLEQTPRAALTVADTMDLWINIDRDNLLTLLSRIDGLVLNDSEAKLLTGEDNLVTAGRRVRELGPKFVIVKKGEHGAMFFDQDGVYSLPAFPTDRVVDPTGAGDSFAGGMMGYLASVGRHDAQTIKTALAYGIVVASFNVEDFSLDRMRQIERVDLDRRFEEYRRMLRF